MTDDNPAGATRPRDWLQSAKLRLSQGGLSDCELDCRRLLEHVTGLTALDLIRDPLRTLDAETLVRLDAALERRLLREPVSRIIGEREFFSRKFRVTLATLDPRPETETLIEAALEIVASEGLRDRPIRFADIGTGTGCIAITLLAELPLARAVATDLSPAALAVAAENAARHGVADRLQLQKADLLDGVQGSFDFVVSNPPYIETADIARLAPDVRLYDPRLALDGGPDGLACYRRLLSMIKSYVPDGWSIFEIPDGRLGEVFALGCDALGQPGPEGFRAWRDLGKAMRAVAFRTRQ